MGSYQRPAKQEDAAVVRATASSTRNPQLVLQEGKGCVLARSVASQEMLCSDAPFSKAFLRGLSARLSTNLTFCLGVFTTHLDGKNYSLQRSLSHYVCQCTPIRQTLHTFHSQAHTDPPPLARSMANVPVQSIGFCQGTDKEPEHNPHRHMGTGKSCKH